MYPFVSSQLASPMIIARCCLCGRSTFVLPLQPLVILLESVDDNRISVHGTRNGSRMCIVKLIHVPFYSYVA